MVSAYISQTNFIELKRGIMHVANCNRLQMSKSLCIWCQASNQCDPQLVGQIVNAYTQLSYNAARMLAEIQFFSLFSLSLFFFQLFFFSSPPHVFPFCVHHTPVLSTTQNLLVFVRHANVLGSAALHDSLLEKQASAMKNQNINEKRQLKNDVKFRGHAHRHT